MVEINQEKDKQGIDFKKIFIVSNFFLLVIFVVFNSFDEFSKADNLFTNRILLLFIFLLQVISLVLIRNEKKEKEKKIYYIFELASILFISLTILALLISLFIPYRFF